MADGSSDISVDDPDFWQKWAEKAKLDLDELANKVKLVYIVVHVHNAKAMKQFFWCCVTG